MPHTATRDRVADVVRLLQRARSLLFITGAGLSADSGLPTYRGIGGLYDGRDADEDLPIETLLSGKMFASRPELTWKYLLQVEQACRAARPNRGHEIIAAMERRFERVWVLTQNVDGFHHVAGSRNVIDIHGNLHQIRCTQCAFAETVKDYAHLDLPPRCPDCHGILRPDVVLFGEALPTRQVERYHAEVGRGFDVVFSVGTTSVFPYIAAPMLDAHSAGRPAVEINPGETEVSEFASIRLPGRAAETLEAIWAGLDRGPGA
jgi:NAD-dependent deacetylase